MEVVAEVFNEVQDSSTISSKLVYTLLEQYETNRVVFLQAMEQCYLKIVKNMLRAPRKLVEKYEKLTEKLFETAYRQYASKADDEDDGDQGKKIKSKKNGGSLTKRDIHLLFQHFLAFFAGALDSTQIQIRVFASRIVFQLLKILPSQVLIATIEEKVARALILGTLSLMKEKKGNLKLIGIKITSYLQKLMERVDIVHTPEAQVLRNEMLRSMCMDDQDQIRKLALINLEMTEASFPHLIKRIRDKNPDIRATVFKKLIKEQVPLANLNLSDIYKLVYDGLGSRESQVREACIRYLSLNYSLFKEEAIDVTPLPFVRGEQLLLCSYPQGEKMDVEERKEGEATAAASGSKITDIDEIVKETRLKIVNFLSTFDLEKSLYYPELSESLEQLVKELIKSIITDSDGLSLYLRDCFVNHLSLKKKKKHTHIVLSPEEILLIRVVCSMVQSKEDRAFVPADIISVIEDSFPTGAEFSSVVSYFAFTQPNLYSLYQTLLTAELLINCDEASRNKLEETLKHLVLSMNNTQLISDIPTDSDQEEYNDVFYKLEPESVKNNIFAQAYFQSPIITCSYELLPLIVRILKKVVRDGRVNVQLIQLISEVHEPLAKDSDNETHFDLPSELERIQKAIVDERARLEAIEKELTAVKRIKSKQHEVYELEKEKEEHSEIVKIWEEKEGAMYTRIFDISMRQLILVQALLTSSKVDPKDQAIINLLQQIILPGLSSAEDNLVAHSLKALALYVLIDRNYCNDFFSTFSDLLVKNDACASCSPQEIISLRSIVDFILLYDFSHKTSDEDEEIDIPFAQELILKYAFQADTLLRTISIEGLSKLLFNGKLHDPHSMVCLLMVIWFDTKICQKEGFKAVQILSTLFKTFTASSFANLQVFERALELFSQLIVTLEKKGLVFNEDYVVFEHTNENFTSKALRVGINLISYEYHKSTDVLTSDQQTEFGPQERYFIFLAYKCAKDMRFQSLFEKVTPFFDFVTKTSINELQVILKFLTDATENCTTSKSLQAVQKQLQDRIRAIDKKSKAGDEEDETAVVVVVAADSIEEDSMLFKLAPRQTAICEKLVEQIEANLVELDVILKNLQDSNIILHDSQELKERRNTKVVVDEAEEDEGEDEEGEEENVAEEQDEEEVIARKPRARKTNRRKAMKEPEEDEGEEEEAKTPTTSSQKKRGRKAEVIAKRGKKGNNPQAEEEEEEEEGEEEELEEEVEEVVTKRTTLRRGAANKAVVAAPQPEKARRGAKKAIVVEVEDEEEEEESSEEEEEVVEEVVKATRRRGKNAVAAAAAAAAAVIAQAALDKKTNRRKGGLKAPVEVEEEEEEEEVVVVSRRQSSRGRKSEAKEDEEEEKPVTRRGKKSQEKPTKVNTAATSRRGASKKPESEEEEEEVEEIKTADRKRGRSAVAASKKAEAAAAAAAAKSEKAEKKPRGRRGAVKEEIEVEAETSETESDVEEEEQPKGRGTRQRSTRIAARGRQKKVESEESGAEVEEEDEKEEAKTNNKRQVRSKQPTPPPAKLTAAAAKAAAAAAPVRRTRRN